MPDRMPSADAQGASSAADPDEAFDVIERLMDEHVAILNATTPLRHADEPNTPARAAAVASLKGQLVAHLALENALFEVLREHDDFVEHLDGLDAEHATLAGRLASLEGADAHDVHRFIAALREHMDGEDGGLFKAAGIELRRDDWGRVARLHRSAVTAGEG